MTSALHDGDDVRHSEQVSSDVDVSAEEEDEEVVAGTPPPKKVCVLFLCPHTWAFPKYISLLLSFGVS